MRCLVYLSQNTILRRCCHEYIGQGTTTGKSKPRLKPKPANESVNNTAEQNKSYVAFTPRVWQIRASSKSQ